MRMGFVLLIALSALSRSAQSPIATSSDSALSVAGEKAAEIEKLVKQLASSNPKARERAAKAILKIGEAALPFLNAAKKSDDLELKRRAEELYSKVFTASEESRLGRQVARATEFGIDTFIDRVVANRDNVTKSDWEVFAT